MKKKFLLLVLGGLVVSSCKNKSLRNSQLKNISDSTNFNTQMIQNKSFTASIIVDQSPSKAFKSILDFRVWWSEEIEGPTDKLNESFFYHYKDIHLCKIKLIEVIPEKRIVYQVLENEFNFVKDKSEWVNTHLVFELTEEAGKTKLTFTHEGLVPEYECYKVCNDAWSGYIKNSLYNLIVSGKGNPNPKDKDGFNAELAAKWKLN